MAKHLEPDVFIRAYGNIKCKEDVSKILEQEGFQLRFYPDGRTELYKGEEKLGEYPGIKCMIFKSNYSDPFSFANNY